MYRLADRRIQTGRQAYTDWQTGVYGLADRRVKTDRQACTDWQTGVLLVIVVSIVLYLA